MSSGMVSLVHFVVPDGAEAEDLGDVELRGDCGR